MKGNKGITLISLMITIIIMLILASITITTISGSNDTVKETEDSNKRFELQEVQQIVLETYIKFKQTGNEEYLAGTLCEENILKQYENEVEKKLQDESYSNYYMLDSKTLKELGIQDSKDSYIANYETGEVFNYTTKKTSEGNVLYVNVNE